MQASEAGARPGASAACRVADTARRHPATALQPAPAGPPLPLPAAPPCTGRHPAPAGWWRTRAGTRPQGWPPAAARGATAAPRAGRRRRWHAAAAAGGGEGWAGAESAWCGPVQPRLVDSGQDHHCTAPSQHFRQPKPATLTPPTHLVQHVRLQHVGHVETRGQLLRQAGLACGQADGQQQLMPGRRDAASLWAGQQGCACWRRAEPS